MYRVRSTGQLVTQGEVRRMYPKTSFPKVWKPELVESLGLDPVFESPQPEVGRYGVAFKDGVEQDNRGDWRWKWAIGPVFADYTDDEGVTHTAAEQEAAYKASKDTAQADLVRADRNKRLEECDWTQVADAPVNQAAWAAYRQALRDVPEQAGFPWEVEWPEQP